MRAGRRAKFEKSISGAAAACSCVGMTDGWPSASVAYGRVCRDRHRVTGRHDVDECSRRAWNAWVRPLGVGRAIVKGYEGVAELSSIARTSLNLSSASALFFPSRDLCKNCSAERRRVGSAQNFICPSPVPRVLFPSLLSPITHPLRSKWLSESSTVSLYVSPFELQLRIICHSL